MKSLLHFCKFLVNANFDVATKYVFKTAFNSDSDDILSLRKYCQRFTHESNTILCFKNTLKSVIQTYKGQKLTKPPLPLGMWTPSNNGPPTHHPKVKRYLDRFTHFGTTTLQTPHTLQLDVPNSPTNYPFPCSNPKTQLTASSVHPADPSPQTASRSNQPFPQCTGQTDSHTQTDRWSR